MLVQPHTKDESTLTWDSLWELWYGLRVKLTLQKIMIIINNNKKLIFPSLGATDFKSATVRLPSVIPHQCDLKWLH